MSDKLPALAAASVAAAAAFVYYYFIREPEVTAVGNASASLATTATTEPAAAAAPASASSSSLAGGIAIDALKSGAGLADYLEAFEGLRSAEPFLTYYSVAADKSLDTQTFTRGEFLELALRAASVVRRAGIAPGEHQTHFFSCNTVGDLAFRLASVLLGTTPVTINWQADTAEKVHYMDGWMNACIYTRRRRCSWSGRTAI